MATTTDLRVSDLVREAMDRLGLTQAALAGILGMPREALNARLNARTRWTIAEVAALARVLELDLHALLEDEAASCCSGS